jgi:RNA polymerase sigma-70 factor, ECF subfamily
VTLYYTDDRQNPLAHPVIDPRLLTPRIAGKLQFMNEPATPAQERSTDATSLSLLQRVRDQDRTAWERFVHLYEPVVRRWCERAGLQPSDAADLTQDLFHTVFTRLDTFRHDQPGASFRGWLWTITRNRIALHFRNQSTRPHPAGGDSAFQHLATPADDDTTAPPESKAEVVRRALELIRPEFEPATWQAFWKVQVEDQPVASTATALGLSTNAVYKARARVLRRLRDEFGELIE